MNESYKDLKAYLLNEIAEDARGVLNAIEGKKVDKVDDEEVLCFCHDLAFAMTTLETVAMVAALVPDFLESKRCLVSGPARRALVHGLADAPRVTSAQIGETERRARALERDRARALKRSRKAKR